MYLKINLMQVFLKLDDGSISAVYDVPHITLGVPLYLGTALCGAFLRPSGVRQYRKIDAVVRDTCTRELIFRGVGLTDCYFIGFSVLHQDDAAKIKVLTFIAHYNNDFNMVLFTSS